VMPTSMVRFSCGPPQLVILAIVFGIVNAFIKPVVKLLSFPVSMMTLGLSGIVVNAALLMLVAYAAYTFADVAFTVGGFPKSGITADTAVGAVVASVVLGVISTIVGLVVHD
jgi:putative membrane protein